ncbi:MAG: hypothetical protein DWQ29_08990 [Planctomycetota bacterium]|nr:MAG: hypothetical protein DWQ29_08990 [Planctomycetota bacterium]
MTAPGSRSRSGYGLLLLAAFLWSLSGLFTKNEWIASIPLESRGPVLACCRAFFAAAFVAPFVRRRSLRFRTAMIPMAVSYASMNVLFVTALTHTTAAAAIFLQYTAAAWAAVLGWLLLRERAGRADLFALAFALAGIAVIVGSESGREDLFGNLLGLGSGVTYAGVIIGLRSLRDENPFWLVTINNVTAGVVLLPWVAGADVSLSAAQWTIAAGFGVLQLGVPYLLFARAVREVPAHEATLLAILEAVLNPIWVWIFIGERAPVATWLGGGLIVAGLVLRYTIFRRRRTDSQPQVAAEQPEESRTVAPKMRRNRLRRTVGWSLLSVAVVLLLCQAALKTWQWAAVPSTAPRIGVSYDTAWHARAGISTKNYEVCLTRAGAAIVELRPEVDDPETVLDRIDALLLTGGGDVDPQLYGGDAEDGLLVDRSRDDFELALIAGALQRDMPILGVCRGIQILNVAHGGTLQNLRSDPESNERHGISSSSFAAHMITIEPDSLLADLLGVKETEVNSFHGQAVDAPGAGLRVVAVADDGVIEGMERPDKTFVLVTQWHPEIPPADMRYFQRLVAEAIRFRERTEAVNH